MSTFAVEKEMSLGVKLEATGCTTGKGEISLAFVSSFELVLWLQELRGAFGFFKRLNHFSACYLNHLYWGATKIT